MRIRTVFAFAMLAMLATQNQVCAQIAPAPRMMQFQGKLIRPDGSPVPNGNYPMRFSLWDAASGGTEKWSQTLPNVPVHNGIIAVLIGLLTANTFDGDRWLEIKIGVNAPLSPRQQVVSVAYAMKANSVADGAITSASIANGTITGADIADGSLSAAKFGPNILNPLAWLLNGNSGTNPPTQFLGTTDDQPLVIKVNNARAMRYRYVEDTSVGGFEYRAINILGGSEINSIGNGVKGATIAGGGRDYFTFTDNPNSVTADFGTISGGLGNTVSGPYAVVSGGSDNSARNEWTTIAGGDDNIASSSFATVSGGGNNTASGFYSTVIGGYNNEASGAYSTAMGRNSRALHTGSFVFNNNLGTFTSTANNQFLIRADGGVGIGTSSPNALLDVSGNAHFASKVGIGTTNPLTMLHVEGSLHLSGTTQDISTDVGNNLQIGHYDGTTFTERILMDGTGHVGINDSSPTYRLELPNIASDGEGRARANRWDTYSSGRWKHNVVPIEDALGKVLRMRGVMFDWNPEHGGTRDIGFVAEEVGNVIPELVSWEVPGKAALGMAYDRVTALLVEAVKSLKKEKDDLRAQKDAEISELKTRMESLEAAVRALQIQQR